MGSAKIPVFLMPGQECTTYRQRADIMSSFRSMPPMALGAHAPRLVGLLIEDREFRHSVLQLVRRLHRRIGPQFVPAEQLLSSCWRPRSRWWAMRTRTSSFGGTHSRRSGNSHWLHGEGWARLCAPFIPLIAEMAHQGAAGGLSLSTGTTALWVLWRLLVLADASCLAMLHDHRPTMLEHWLAARVGGAWSLHGVPQMPRGCPAQLAQHARSRHTATTQQQGGGVENVSRPASCQVRWLVCCAATARRRRLRRHCARAATPSGTRKDCHPPSF